MTEQEMQEIANNIKQGLFRKDPEYIEAVRLTAMLFLNAKGDKMIESLAIRTAHLLCLLLGIDDKMMQADLMFVIMMAIAEGSKHDAN